MVDDSDAPAAPAHEPVPPPTEEDENQEMPAVALEPHLTEQRLIRPSASGGGGASGGAAIAGGGGGVATAADETEGVGPNRHTVSPSGNGHVTADAT
jgi:hypothetical protein